MKLVGILILLGALQSAPARAASEADLTNIEKLTTEVDARCTKMKGFHHAALEHTNLMKPLGLNELVLKFNGDSNAATELCKGTVSALKEGSRHLRSELHLLEASLRKNQSGPNSAIATLDKMIKLVAKKEKLSSRAAIDEKNFFAQQTNIDDASVRRLEEPELRPLRGKSMTYRTDVWNFRMEADQAVAAMEKLHASLSILKSQTVAAVDYGSERDNTAEVDLSTFDSSAASKMPAAENNTYPAPIKAKKAASPEDLVGIPDGNLNGGGGLIIEPVNEE